MNRILVDWISIDDSTLVSAIGFDKAAERIYVRLHSGDEWVFDDCREDLWQTFRAAGASKGEFIKNVLERHSHRRVPRVGSD